SVTVASSYVTTPFGGPQSVPPLGTLAFSHPRTAVDAAACSHDAVPTLSLGTIADVHCRRSTLDFRRTARFKPLVPLGRISGRPAGAHHRRGLRGVDGRRCDHRHPPAQHL